MKSQSLFSNIGTLNSQNDLELLHYETRLIQRTIRFWLSHLFGTMVMAVEHLLLGVKISFLLKYFGLINVDNEGSLYMWNLKGDSSLETSRIHRYHEKKAGGVTAIAYHSSKKLLMTASRPRFHM